MNKHNSFNQNFGENLAQQKNLALTITDTKMLYVYYMPFIKGCGIFVPTEEEFQLNQQVSLALTLLTDEQYFSVIAKVVWLNPLQKMAQRVPGIGLQIVSQEAELMREKIEQILGKSPNVSLPTATM